MNVARYIIWLDSTLEPIAEHRPPRPKPSSKRIVYLMAFLVVAAIGGWSIHRALRTAPAEHVQAGWQAYHQGDYQKSTAALAAAEAQAPDAPGIGDLRIALEIAPTLDSIERELDDGQVEAAHQRMQEVLTQAPQDRRAVRLAIRLRTIQANAHLARADSRAPQSVAAAVAAPQSVVAVATPQSGASTAPKTNAPAPQVPAPASAAIAPASLAAVTTTGRPRRRRVQKRTGRLRVTSEVPAVVLIDGVLRAQQTPVSIDIALGNHAVELRQAADGKLLIRRTVQVRRGRQTAVNFEQAKSAAALAATAVAPATQSPTSAAAPTTQSPTSAAASGTPDAAAAASAETPAPATAPASAGPASVASVAAPTSVAAVSAPASAAAIASSRTLPLTGPTGFLSVTSARPAQLILDGRSTGQMTPVWMYKVSAGRHRIALRDRNGTFGGRVVVIPPKQMIPVVIRKGAPK